MLDMVNFRTWKQIWLRINIIKVYEQIRLLVFRIFFFLYDVLKTIPITDRLIEVWAVRTFSSSTDARIKFQETKFYEAEPHANTIAKLQRNCDFGSPLPMQSSDVHHVEVLFFILICLQFRSNVIMIFLSTSDLKMEEVSYRASERSGEIRCMLAAM